MCYINYYPLYGILFLTKVFYRNVKFLVQWELFSNECTQARSKLYYYISGQAQPTLRTHVHYIHRLNIDGRAVSADV